MTIEQTQIQLQAVIEDSENKVVALSGAWGTGKSHLWEIIRSENDNSNIRDALYASLFGMSELASLKVKLAEQALLKDLNHRKISVAMEQYNKIRPALKRLIPKADLLEEVALLATPKILNGRFVVLDDIERKGEGLTIDHILGFIDEHVQRHNVRFLIIMNTDKLDDAPMWEVLREKVVDHEIRLMTTPKEAFRIANNLCPTSHPEIILKAIETIGVVNIRIIKKIIRAVNLIFDNHQSLKYEILNRMIPSTVLLAATHYKGIENGPPIDFILAPLSYKTKKQPKDLTEEEINIEKKRSDWRSMIEALDIGLPDDYEPLVANFLSSGLLERSKLDEILKSYEKDARKIQFNNDLRDFYQNMYWDATKSASDLICEASALCENIKFANARTITELSESVSHLDGGKEISDKIVVDWIEAANEQLNTTFEHYNFSGELHPKIVERLQQAEYLNEISMNIVDVCSVIQKGGWSQCHENALNFKCPEHYEDFIRHAKATDLKIVLLNFQRLYRNRKAYQNFDPAINSFVAACQNIIAGPPSRLTQIVTRIMNDAGMPHIEESESMG